MLITDATLAPYLVDGQAYDPEMPETFNGARDFERVRYLPAPRPQRLAGTFVRRLAPVGRYVLYSPLYLFAGFFVSGIPMAGLVELGVIQEGNQALAVISLLFCALLIPPLRRYRRQRGAAKRLFRDGTLLIGSRAPDWKWIEVRPEDGDRARGHISGTVHFDFCGKLEAATIHDDFYTGPGAVGDEVPVLILPDVPYVAVFLPTGDAIKAKRVIRPE